MPKPTTDETITAADTAFLRALNRFHYLTAAQASRLLYPNLKDENRYSQRRLAKLVRLGYALRLRALETPVYGSAPHVFTLARRGRQYMERLGIATTAYYRPSEEQAKAHNHLFMTHTLAAIDLLIAVDLLCQASPVSYPVLLCERELRHRAVRVELPPAPGSAASPKTVAVIPDGWFQLAVADTHTYSISLELDRGTEDQKSWRRKVAALCAWAEGPYRQAFRTDNVTIAVVTTRDARRDQLRTWTARELTERQLERLADLFLFTSADLVTTSPGALFFDPLWYLPDADMPVSLLATPITQVATPFVSARQEAVVLEL